MTKWCVKCKNRERRSDSNMCDECYMMDYLYQHRSSDIGICTECKNPCPINKSRCINCRKRDQLKRLANKLAVIEEYGGVCQCPSGKCFERNPGFLTVDHIDNDGKKHREEIGGQNIYNWLLSNGCPKDKYRIMCFNCNCGRNAHKGKCPHFMKGDEYETYLMPLDLVIENEENFNC